MTESVTRTQDEFMEAVEEIAKEQLIEMLLLFDDRDVVVEDEIREATHNAAHEVAEQYPACTQEYLANGRELQGTVELSAPEQMDLDYSIDKRSVSFSLADTVDELLVDILSTAAVPAVARTIEGLITGEWNGVEEREGSVEKEVDVGDETQVVEGTKQEYIKNFEVLNTEG